jgi:mechanosensitive ion channel-like protein
MSGNGLGQGLSDMWRSVLLFLPKALVFLVILVVGYLVARLLRAAVGRLLKKAGFDRAVERGAVGRMLAGKVGASDVCARLVFYGILLFALQLAFGVWGPNPVADLLTELIAWLPRAFVAIVIIVVAAAIAGAVHDLIASTLGGLAYGKVLAKAVAIVIVTLGVIAALDQVEIATGVTRPLLIAVLATVAGVVIVGVGGGLIRPMQARWEGWLDKAETESAAMREHARAYAEERARQTAAEEARKAEEARRAAEEEARRAEEARKAEDDRRAAEEARRAAEEEERRAAEEARRAEETRRSEERLREAARRSEEARTANATTAAQPAVTPEPAANATTATQAAVTPEPAASAATAAQPAVPPEPDRRENATAAVTPEENATTATQPAVMPGEVPAAETEETQVIPVQQTRPHLIPGFDRDDDTTTVIRNDVADTTVVNPGHDETVVIGSGTEEETDETQVIEEPRPRRSAE